MTSHELAHQLLAGPDLPVVVSVTCDDDSVSATNNLVTHVGTSTPDRQYVCRDGQWRDSQNPKPTHVFVEAKADHEFQTELFENDE